MADKRAKKPRFEDKEPELPSTGQRDESPEDMDECSLPSSLSPTSSSPKSDPKEESSKEQASVGSVGRSKSSSKVESAAKGDVATEKVTEQPTRQSEGPSSSRDQPSSSEKRTFIVKEVAMYLPGASSSKGDGNGKNIPGAAHSNPLLVKLLTSPLKARPPAAATSCRLDANGYVIDEDESGPIPDVSLGCTTSEDSSSSDNTTSSDSSESQECDRTSTVVITLLETTRKGAARWAAPSVSAKVKQPPSELSSDSTVAYELEAKVMPKPGYSAAAEGPSNVSAPSGSASAERRETTSKGPGSSSVGESPTVQSCDEDAELEHKRKRAEDVPSVVASDAADKSPKPKRKKERKD